MLTRSKGRFAVDSPGPGLMLHADAQEFNRAGDHRLTGHVTSDRRLRYVRLVRGVIVSSATVPVEDVRESAGRLTLLLGKGTSPQRQLVLSSNTPPKHIRFNGRVIQAEPSRTEYLISLPEYEEQASLEIVWQQTSAEQARKYGQAGRPVGPGILQ